jgi:hypothetical protein
MNEILVRIPIKAPMPYLHRDAAPRFNNLRERTKHESGHDFLAICGDVLRSPDFVSSKDGVANRSWHKTARAFDYDQTHSALVLVSEPINGKQFFRTYLRCAKQDGSMGILRSVRDMRGFKVNAFLFDFTAAAEALGWKRIPAWNGWQQRYNRREFWHYQFDEGLTWAEAMAQLRSGAAINKPQTPSPNKGADERVYGRNDRGEAVRLAQQQLSKLGFLPQSEVDGVFGAKTHLAVSAFQKHYRLEADGLIGKETRAALADLTK